jgi:ATP-binding cassette subfamily F protein 3
MGIHRCRLRKIAGNTAKYYDQIAQDEEVYEKTRINDDRRRREIELFISRFRAKARLANLVQSRVKTLQKLEKKEKLAQLKSLEFSFRSSPFPGKQVLAANHLTFGYDKQKQLIQNFSIRVASGERICVVGKNGKGKTTLLKLLAGDLAPQSGQIVYHPAVRKGVFEQSHVRSLVADRTVEEEILYSQPDFDRQRARNICGAMLFSGDDALKKIHVLSGGEKSRVMLAKLLVTPVNLLLLDEPTNHLDMESSDALLTALDCFEGTVIMVTHNEMFLHSLAERLIVFQHDRLESYDGSYREFLDQYGWRDEKLSSLSNPSPKNRAENSSKRTKKEIRRHRSEIITRRSKAIKPLENRIARLEDMIEAREIEMSHFNDAMQQASQHQDALRIRELSQSIHSCQSKIDNLFEELEKTTDELNAQNAVFERELRPLQP